MTAPVPPGRHPNWCNCAGCRRDIAEFESKQFKGTVGVAAAVIAFALLGFWPAIVWHGQNDMGGWRWDVHSTVACMVWWGILASVSAAIGVADARRRRLMRPVRMPPSAAEAREAVEDLDRGWPRRDLRDAAGDPGRDW